MALNSVDIGYAGATPAASLAAPTVSETISNPDDRTYLMVVIGATATVVTIVRPGTDAVGVAVADQVTASLSNTTRVFKVDRHYKDPATAAATVTFSQVTGVTACVLRG